MTRKNKGGFKIVQTAEELVAYLKNTSDRLPNETGKPCMLYHYTRLENLEKIVNDKTWLLSSPKKMNDGLERENSASSSWNGLYFSSFMKGAKESLAMWSMYAQPWEDGVKIALPATEVRKWIK